MPVERHHPPLREEQLSPAGQFGSGRCSGRRRTEIRRAAEPVPRGDHQPPLAFGEELPVLLGPRIRGGQFAHFRACRLGRCRHGGQPGRAQRARILQVHDGGTALGDRPPRRSGAEVLPGSTTSMPDRKDVSATA